MFGSIVEAIYTHARENPQKLCVVDGTGEYTYRDIWKFANETAALLREKGAEKGGHIIVECTQDARYLVCAMACQLLGAVFVPVENRATQERIKEITQSVCARIYVGKTVYETQTLHLDIEDLFQPGRELPEEQCFLPPSDKDAVAEILYTTGTTGKPKGIVLSNGNNVAVAENVLYGTEMKKDSVELVPLPLSHSHGLRSCYAHFVNGSTVVVTDGVMRVKEIFDLIEKYGINAMDLSPSAARILLKLSKGGLKQYAHKIEYIQIGTAVLPEDVKEELCRIFDKSRLYNFYGSTEAGRCALLDFNHMRGYHNCIGKPSRHAHIVIVDEQRQPMDATRDNPGTVAIEGEMNMQGYWRDEETTASVMQGGFIYTNDLGYMDQDGLIYVLGRADDVINYQGIKIAPEDIEICAAKYSGISDCACVPMPDQICGQVPRLFVVAKEPDGFDRKDFMEFLSKTLEANKLPRQIELIDSIPRTSNGKIQRKKLM